MLHPDAKAANKIYQIDVVDDVDCEHEAVAEVPGLCNNDHDNLREKSYLLEHFNRGLDLYFSQVLSQLDDRVVDNVLEEVLPVA